MAINVKWTSPALAQLRKIYDYHHEVAGARTARKITNKVLSRVDILIQNPKTGPQEELLKDYQKEFRYLVEGNYKIIYWFEADVITITAVFDCRQNPEKIQDAHKTNY